MVKRITPEIVRMLPERGISPVDFFSMSTPALADALGMNPGTGFDQMNRDEALFEARKEAEHMSRHNIHGYSLLSPDYPVRLSQTADAPVYLYKLGEADLDSEHIVSVVGTRRPTPYGNDFCGRLVADLGDYFPDLMVVSGLAYGIDSCAHSACLEKGIKTVAVVAHGLSMIYPAQHRDLARRIIRAGGAIVSEYPFLSTPYRQRFLERNRIVAGLSDVTVVVESDIKGGAMSTANMAFSYSRDVMALPGRISDKESSGCNLLIRKGKANLISGAADLIEYTGWKPLNISRTSLQRNLFPELEGDPRLVYETLRFSREPLHADSIRTKTLIPMPRLMAVLGEMEFDGIIIRHPGNRFSTA